MKTLPLALAASLAAYAAEPSKARAADRLPAGAALEANAGSAPGLHGKSMRGLAPTVFEFETERLYPVRTAPGYLTAIALRAGERLVSKAAGDTVRWSLGETVQGSGDAAQVLVLLKPSAAALRTNLVLTTNERSYYLEIASQADGAYDTLVAWNYPLAELGGPDRRLPVGAGGSSDPTQLNFNYEISRRGGGRTPPWMPTRAFDDGRKTYVALPPAVSAGDAPPLFVVGSGGRDELVNYRVRSGFYVVDRIFEAAELRLGESPQTVVRIRRIGPRP